MTPLRTTCGPRCALIDSCIPLSSDRPGNECPGDVRLDHRNATSSRWCRLLVPVRPDRRPGWGDRPACPGSVGASGGHGKQRSRVDVSRLPETSTLIPWWSDAALTGLRAMPRWVSDSPKRCTTAPIIEVRCAQLSRRSALTPRRSTSGTSPSRMAALLRTLPPDACRRSPSRCRWCRWDESRAPTGEHRLPSAFSRRNVTHTWDRSHRCLDCAEMVDTRLDQLGENRTVNVIESFQVDGRHAGFVWSEPSRECPRTRTNPT